VRRFLPLLLLALFAYLATGIAQVGPDERAVVRRFGRVVARPGPGLWVGLPWGIEQVDRVKMKTWQLGVGAPPEEFGEAPTAAQLQLLTGDQNLVDLRLVVEYTPDDRDGEIERYVAHGDRLEGVLAREAESLAAEWIAGRPVDEVLLTGRAAIPQWMAPRLADRIAAAGLGLIVQRVSVEHLAAPREVFDAFQAVNQAQNRILTRENEARQEAAARLRDAEATRFRLQTQADAYRREKVSLAKADADAFAKRLDQYRRLRATNPDVLAAIWWDEMGRTLLGMRGRGRVDVLDQHLGPNGLDVTQFLPAKKK
jgi:membrane protease subunit HflK